MQFSNQTTLGSVVEAETSREYLGNQLPSRSGKGPKILATATFWRLHFHRP